jgi:hypothetical protein
MTARSCGIVRSCKPGEVVRGHSCRKRVRVQDGIEALERLIIEGHIHLV